MPQTPILIGLLNSTRALPAADLPIDPTYLVEVQPPSPVLGVDPPRQQVSLSSILAGGGGVAGSGTATHLSMWSAGDTITDSLITQAGGVILISANGHITGTLLVDGAATIDDTLHVTGTLTADGATTIDDTLHVTGAITADAGFNALFIGGSIDPALTAVGTNRGNSLALTKQTNIVTTAASSAVGVTLPSAAAVGVGNWVDVYNDGPSNSFHVYAAGSDTIDTIAGATGVLLTNDFWARYFVTAALTFKSYRTPIVRSA